MNYPTILAEVKAQPGVKRTEDQNAFIAAVLSQVGFLFVRNVKAIMKSVGENDGSMDLGIKVKVNEEENRVATGVSWAVKHQVKVASTLPDPKQKDFKFDTVPE